jgi:hypothetical protein
MKFFKGALNTTERWLHALLRYLLKTSMVSTKFDGNHLLGCEINEYCTGDYF